jgi:hypothetical protein
MYTVNLWDSHPDENNDDCNTGLDCATLEEAKEAFNNPWEYFNVLYFKTNTMWFILDGPDCYMERKNPDYKASKHNNNDWLEEQAMQAGMAFGCDGYNDAKGY